MENINKKFDNTEGAEGELSAAEANSIINALKNLIRKSNINLDASITTQSFESLDRVTKLNFYDDVGIVNEIHLTRKTIDDTGIVSVFDGLSLFFSPKFSNTGAVNLRLSDANTFPLVNFDNTELTNHRIIQGHVYMIKFDAENSKYILYNLDSKPNNGFLAKAVIKSKNWGALEGDNALGIIDQHQSHGIKSITLDLFYQYPEDLSQFKVLDSASYKMYKVEMKLSPVDENNLHIGFCAGDGVFPWKWGISHAELEDTGFPNPYNKRIIYYIEHFAMHAGLEKAVTTYPAPEAAVWLQAKKDKYPYVGDYDRHFEGGGWLFWGDNWLVIPENLENQ